MEDFASYWTFQEDVEELKQKLEYVTYELEITRKVTNEEIMKNNENIKKLLLLLQLTCKERDNAISKFTKLQQFLAVNNNKTPSFQTTPFSPHTPLLSNNNSNSLSQHICFSGAGSPIDITSVTPTSKAVDRGTLIIDKLAKGRPRPCQGKLLQAVIEVGPLLQTLMIAGSLPEWRNPPGLMTQQGPPRQPKECTQSPSDGQNSGELSGCYSSSMLDFGGALYGGSFFVGGGVMSSTVNFDCRIPKRQRIQ